MSSQVNGKKIYYSLSDMPIDRLIMMIAMMKTAVIVNDYDDNFDLDNDDTDDNKNDDRNVFITIWATHSRKVRNAKLQINQIISMEEFSMAGLLGSGNKYISYISSDFKLIHFIPWPTAFLCSLV